MFAFLNLKNVFLACHGKDHVDVREEELTVHYLIANGSIYLTFLSFDSAITIQNLPKNPLKKYGKTFE